MTPVEPEPAREDAAERDRILASYFRVRSVDGDHPHLVKRFLLGAVWAAVLVPALFYLKFGVIDGFAIGFTIFVVVLDLLFALGFYLRPKTEYHTKVQPRGGIGDKIAGFWLVACAFGPLIGWTVTEPIAPTETSWKYQYLARVFFAAFLPLFTALLLIPYARGKAALIVIPLLIGVTALPLSSCFWVVGDLHDGVVVSDVLISVDSGAPTCNPVGPQRDDVPCNIRDFLRVGREIKVAWLPHTGRILKVSRRSQL